MQEATKSNSRRRWLELDLLRTLAVLLMILNHVAVGFDGSRDAPFIDAMNFVGSFAPVLFFFLTGLGNGVQSVGKAPSRGAQHLIKIGILLAADVFLWVRPGRLIGMDFLGFIAISAVLLKELQRIPRSGAAAGILAMLVLAVRFAVGPMLRARLPDSPLGHALASCLGIRTIEGFSYPLAPWLFYPLFGYVLGRTTARSRSWIENHRFQVVGPLTLAAVVFAAAATVLAINGAEVFRWGAMSFCFFVASLAAVSTCLAATLAAGGRESATAFATGAQQSFAVVPLHYALLVAAVALLGPVRGEASYARNTLCIVALSFAGAEIVARASTALRASGGRLVNLIWGFVLAASVVGAVVLATNEISKPVSVAIRATCQLGLCVLLGLPLPTRTRNIVDREPQHARIA